MLGMNLTYLTVIGIIYLLVAAYNAVVWAQCTFPLFARWSVWLPRFRLDHHSFYDVVIGLGHIVVDIIIHLPS